MDEIKPIPWRGFNVLEKLIVVLLPAIAIGVILLPLLDAVFIRRLARLPGMRSLITWLVNDNGTWIVSLVLLGVLALFLLWKRRQLLNDKRLWFGTGCPACFERELVRVSRIRGDRLYALAAIPAYRYACRNCTWRGLRIARREHTPELDAALEEALLRFDPNEPRPHAMPDQAIEPVDAVAVISNPPSEEPAHSAAAHENSLGEELVETQDDPTLDQQSKSAR